MKRHTFIISALLLFASCTDTTNSSSKNNSQPKQTEEGPKINDFVISFAGNNSNWFQNSVINNRVDKVFKDSLTKRYQTDGIFDDYAFKFEDINEFSKGKFAAKFENLNDNISETRKISVEVVGLVDDKIVNQLIKNKTYNISGNFVKFLDNDLKKYFDYGFFNVSIGFEPLVDSTYFLGTALVKITKVTPLDK